MRGKIKGNFFFDLICIFLRFCILFDKGCFVQVLWNEFFIQDFNIYFEIVDLLIVFKDYCRFKQIFIRIFDIRSLNCCKV